MELLYTLWMLVFLIYSVTAAEDAPRECPDIVYDRGFHARVHDGICYMFVNQEVYWKEASEYCQNMGGDLVTIKNAATMTFLKEQLNSRELGWDRNGVWIGARYYSDSGWVWVTGDKLAYTYWARNEPRHLLGLFKLENCVVMRRADDWRWHDYHCRAAKYHYNFVCQFPVAYAYGEKGLSAQLPVNEHGNNGNLSILLIIIGLGVLIIIAMVVVFLLYRKRQKDHNQAQSVIVRFENHGYGQADPNGSRDESLNQNGISSRPVSNIYVAPDEMEALYEEVRRLGDGKATDSNQNSNHIEPDQLSVSSSCEGAVGGVTISGGSEDDEQAQPLMEVLAESPGSPKGKGIYLEMNCGSKSGSSASEEDVSPRSQEKKSTESLNSQKNSLSEHTYANTQECRDCVRRGSVEKPPLNS